MTNQTTQAPEKTVEQAADKPAQVIATGLPVATMKRNATKALKGQKVAEVLEADTKQMHAMQSQIVALQTELAEVKAQAEKDKAAEREAEKIPVSDEALKGAIETLRNLSKDSTSPVLSLSKQLGGIPAFTKSQAATWKKAKHEIRVQCSANAKHVAPEIKKLVNRTLQSKEAIASFRKNVRKTDDKVSSFTFKGGNLAPQAKKAKAKK